MSITIGSGLKGDTNEKSITYFQVVSPVGLNVEQKQYC